MLPVASPRGHFVEVGANDALQLVEYAAVPVAFAFFSRCNLLPSHDDFREPYLSEMAKKGRRDNNKSAVGSPKSCFSGRDNVSLYVRGRLCLVVQTQTLVGEVR
jgi:hypothetical protein